MSRAPRRALAPRRARPSFLRRLLQKLWSGLRTALIVIPAFGPNMPPPPPPPPPPVEAQAEDGQSGDEQR
jgi:hypothetical protein